MVDQESAKEKLNAIVKAIKDNDADDILDKRELGFIADHEERQKETDYDFSQAQANWIEDIYEKINDAGLID